MDHGHMQEKIDQRKLGARFVRIFMMSRYAFFQLKSLFIYGSWTGAWAWALGRRVDLSLPKEIRWKVSVRIFMMNRYVFSIKSLKSCLLFMVADLEPELEHKVCEETLLAVLEDAHLLQGLQVHVHRDLSLPLSKCVCTRVKANCFFLHFRK